MTITQELKEGFEAADQGIAAAAKSLSKALRDEPLGRLTAPSRQWSEFEIREALHRHCVPMIPADAAIAALRSLGIVSGEPLGFDRRLEAAESFPVGEEERQ